MTRRRWRHRVTVQSLTLVADNYGQQTETWSDLETVYAEIVTADQREPVNSTDAVVGDAPTMFRIRYATARDLTQKHRLKFGDRTYDIVSVVNRDERNRFFELKTVENEP